jgi:hypothetical protein
MAHTRYATIVAIEEMRVDDPYKYSQLVERLSCGHTSINYGATWKGTAAPLRHHPSQFHYLIGRRRACRDCSPQQESTP